jgi:predicted amidohydrolase
VSPTFKAACVQVTAGRELQPNIETAVRLGREARRMGADFITFPENVTMIEPVGADAVRKALPEAEHPAIPAFRALARETGAWILGGSLSIKLSETKYANRSLLYDPAGNIAARYDKLHLFDVDLAGGESYRESHHARPGGKAVLVDLPFGRLGFSICYDLRFPQLYRALAGAGAEFIAVPAAFTKQTGEAHWHVLIRARAIESGAFVLAATQGGLHENGRATFGHSLIVSPWGEVLAEGGEDPGVMLADIDLAASAEARARIPALKHDRAFEVEIVQAAPAQARKSAS